MTTPAHAEPFGARLPTTDEKAAANQLRTIVAASVADETALTIADAEGRPCEITLTPALSGLLLDMLGHVGKGDAVTLVSVGKVLTTQQAADILDVSRPYLISLLEKGEIGYTLTGRHRRIRASDLFAYKKRRDAARTVALQTLADIDADLI